MKGYSFNTLVEYEASGHLTEPLRFRLSQLEKIAFCLGNPEDFVLVNDLPEPDFLNYWKSLGIALPRAVLSPKECSVPNWIEWGELHDFSKTTKLLSETKKTRFLYYNSKYEQYKWKEEFHLSPLEFQWIESWEEAKLLDSEKTYAVKSAYGVAGREQTSFSLSQLEQKLGFLQKKYNSFPLLIEEWKGKERILDFSTIWNGKELIPEFLTATEMWVDTEGTFRALQISPNSDNKISPYHSSIQSTMESIWNIPKPIPNYTGPLAMDGFLYEEKGKICLQPFSEVNFRWSIGRVLYEWKQQYATRFPNEVKMKSFGIFLVPVPRNGNRFSYELLGKWSEQLGVKVYPLTPIRNSKSQLYPQLGLLVSSPSDGLDLGGLFSFFRGFFF